MSIRIDWPQIVSRIGASSLDAPFLFVLPASGRDLLLAITERLKWQASYRMGEYDYSDWDSLQTYVASTEYGLMTGVNMQALLDLLTDIYTQQLKNELTDISNTSKLETAIEALSFANQINSCCAEYSTATDDPGIVVGEGQPPDEYGGNPINDWEHYQSYLCAASAGFNGNLTALLEELERVIDSKLVLVGGVALILAAFAAPAVGIILAVDFVLAAGVFSSLVNITTSVTIVSLKNYIELHSQELTNIIYCAGSASAAYGAFMAHFAADEEMIGMYQILQFLPIQNAMNIIYAGHDADGNLVETGTSSACQCEGGSVEGDWLAEAGEVSTFTVNDNNGFSVNGVATAGGHTTSLISFGHDAGIAPSGAKAMTCTISATVNQDSKDVRGLAHSVIGSIDSLNPWMNKTVIFYVAGYSGFLGQNYQIELGGQGVSIPLYDQVEKLTSAFGLSSETGTASDFEFTMSVTNIKFHNLFGTQIWP